MADKEVVNFYGKWVQLLAEHEKTIVVKHWDGFQFLCMHLPNGVVGGVEEHLVRLVKRYISQPSSFTPGQLTGEVNQVISLISQKLFLHQGQKVPVDARGFYNELIAEETQLIREETYKVERRDSVKNESYENTYGEQDENGGVNTWEKVGTVFYSVPKHAHKSSKIASFDMVLFSPQNFFTFFFTFFCFFFFI